MSNSLQGRPRPRHGFTGTSSTSVSAAASCEHGLIIAAVRTCAKVADTPVFELIVDAVIFVSAVLLYLQARGDVGDATMDPFDDVVLFIFLLELVLTASSRPLCGVVG